MNFASKFVVNALITKEDFMFKEIVIEVKSDQESIVSYSNNSIK